MNKTLKANFLFCWKKKRLNVALGTRGIWEVIKEEARYTEAI